jgi:hypothetical protein
MARKAKLRKRSSSTPSLKRKGLGKSKRHKTMSKLISKSRRSGKSKMPKFYSLDSNEFLSKSRRARQSYRLSSGLMSMLLPESFLASHTL